MAKSAFPASAGVLATRASHLESSDNRHSLYMSGPGTTGLQPPRSYRGFIAAFLSPSNESLPTATALPPKLRSLVQGGQTGRHHVRRKKELGRLALAVF